jgi:Glycosyl hydrolases family 16
MPSSRVVRIGLLAACSVAAVVTLVSVGSRSHRASEQPRPIPLGADRKAPRGPGLGGPAAELRHALSNGPSAGRAFRAEADSYVRSDKPRASFGTRRRLSVLRRHGQVRRAFLRFDVKVPAAEAVAGAVLKLYPQSRGTSRGIVVHEVSSNDWRQRTLTWRRAPDTGRAVARAERYPRHRWLRLDLDGLVRGPGPVSVAISSRGHAGQRFASREDRRHAPRLVIETVPAAAAEALSRPAGEPPPPPPSAPASGASASGESIPVGDLPGWRQIFTDDFNTPVALGSFPAAVSSKWSAYPNTAHDTSGNGVYHPEKVLSVSGGILNMFIHTEGGKALVAAPIPKLTPTAKYGQLYGRYAVRFRSEALPGYKTAWLLWPDSEVWPRDGEIDFPEANLDDTIKGYVHHQGASSSSDQDRFTTSARYTSWHTATIEWTPGKVVLILDGQIIGQTTTGVPNTPMHWVLQTETALDGGAPSASTQGNVQIDWVAAWSRAAG